MKFLGNGVLNWPPAERVGDRYGLVKLFATPAWRDVVELELHGTEEGQRGRLVAVVKETRKSQHIGDLFHGVFPEMPNTGDKIVLGEGTLFYEGDSVGLRPDDGRETQWLDIRALYRAHDQTVDLYFEPVCVN